MKKSDIEEAIKLLLEGKVIAFPTDTVYGLGVIYDNEAALTALKQAKGREEHKPIPTMIAHPDQLYQVAEVNRTAQILAEHFMPGALTLILKKRKMLADYITNGKDTIGVRMSADPFVLKLIEGCGKPLLVTSANISGEMPGKTGEAVLKQLDGRIDAIVMGEATGDVASTILDVTEEEVRWIRKGIIEEEAIQAVLSDRRTNR